MHAQIERYAVGPRYKGVRGFDDKQIDVKFDSVPLSADADELVSTRFMFFPSRASSDPAHANYIRNPLPKAKSYDIISLGVSFNFDSLIVKPADQSDLAATGLFNDLSDGLFTFRTSEQDTLIDKHIQELEVLDSAGITPYGSDDTGTGDGFTRKLGFPSQMVLRLEDPLHLEAQEVFEVDIDYRDLSNLPDDAAWSSLGTGIPRLFVGMQLVYRD